MTENQYDKILKSRFPASLFWSILGMLLLTAGLNVGLILLSQELNWYAIITVHLIILYWIIVSLLIVLYVRHKIHKTYEIPLQEISKATAKVSQGNFKVRIPTINPPEKYDYLDFMISDLNKMIEDLDGMETLRTDFISNVSHELKTPLAAMQNYAIMLQNPDLTENEKMEYAKAVSSNCRRLTGLITNILKLNKLENQQIYPKVAPYDLGEQLRECVLNFEEAWSSKNIELDADIADEIMVDTDSELLSLVWNNFLSNAIKFTPDGGRISVRLEKIPADKKNDLAPGKVKNAGQTNQNLAEAPQIQVSVQDSGCGMDEKTRAHVFEKFFQGDTSHATKGNGLGLALAARVAAICNASIDVQSEPGKGSTFYFKLSAIS
ncbi:MAG: HAMP domain-containing histidine kinase [Treponema sp.]|nr:HAMP domain-containing histidine kinase [Treponema sp.]